MTTGDEPESQRYEDLLVLEDLESLLEELEEQSLTGSEPREHIPQDIRERMETLGVRDIQQIRGRILHLHAALDDNEDELSITES
jgi:hypothetical protein